MGGAEGVAEEVLRHSEDEGSPPPSKKQKTDEGS